MSAYHRGRQTGGGLRQKELGNVMENWVSSAGRLEKEFQIPKYQRRWSDRWQTRLHPGGRESEEGGRQSEKTIKT